jgi:hypothetical protein
VTITYDEPASATSTPRMSSAFGRIPDLTVRTL